jgi:hypothetical protein
MGFPQYGWKVGISAGAFPVVAQLKPTPGIRWPSAGLHPTFVHRAAAYMYPLCVGSGRPPVHHLRGWVSSTPRALTQVRVVLSRSVIAYLAPSAPLADTPRFHRLADYTRCLRCVGAPRRPASGSGLSFTIPSWHAILYDPGEFDDRRDPVLRHRYCIRRDPSPRGLLLRGFQEFGHRRCRST